MEFVDSMRTLMLTLKFAKINYSTVVISVLTSLCEQSCTVQKVCGINVLFLLEAHLFPLFCCRSAPERYIYTLNFHKTLPQDPPTRVRFQTMSPF